MTMPTMPLLTEADGAVGTRANGAVGTGALTTPPPHAGCPNHSSNCTEFWGITDAARLVEEEEEEEEEAGAGRGAADERACLSQTELESLTRFAVEASVGAAEKVHCPECSGMNLVLPGNGNLPDDIMVCAYCDYYWQVREVVAWWRRR